MAHSKHAKQHPWAKDTVCTLNYTVRMAEKKGEKSKHSHNDLQQMDSVMTGHDRLQPLYLVQHFRTFGCNLTLVHVIGPRKHIPRKLQGSSVSHKTRCSSEESLNASKTAFGRCYKKRRQARPKIESPTTPPPSRTSYKYHAMRHEGGIK